MNKTAKDLATEAAQTILNTIEKGQFKLGARNPINEELAETIFRAILVKEAAPKDRHFNFPIYSLMYSQAVKNCISFAIANNLDDAAIDTVEIKKRMKINPGFFSYTPSTTTLF